MKKIILTIVGLFIAGVAIAAPKWVPTIYSADTQVTSARTIMYDASIYYEGVTAGDSVTFSNGIAVGDTRGTEFYKFVAPAANGTWYYNPEKDLVVDQGIYIDETVTGGTFGIGLTVQ